MRLVRPPQIPQITTAERTSGTGTDKRVFAPADIVAMIQQHESAAANAVPVGAMVTWSSATAPTDWMIYYGQELEPTTYAALYAAIGTRYGRTLNAQGNITHFHLPPAGLFDRIFYPNSANDPDRASRTAAAPGGNTGDNVGSYQADEIKSHSHSFVRPVFFSGETGTSSAFGESVATTVRVNATVETTGGNETRPPNINKYGLIKYL